jgi:YVTN family beta-propeller protein
LGAAGAATGIATNPGVGGYTYVAHPSTDTLSATEYVTNTLVAAITVGDFPTMAAFAGSPYNKVYVSNCSSNTVSVIDINTNTVVNTIPVGNCPRGIAILP